MDSPTPCLENKLSKVSEWSGEFRDAPALPGGDGGSQEDSQDTIIRGC